MAQSKQQLVPLENWREDPAALKAVIEQAQTGDTAVLPILRDILTERPEIWRFWGDLAARNRDVIVHQFSKRGFLIGQSITHQLQALASEIGGKGTPLERLLTDRVCLCWLHLHIAEGIYTLDPSDATHKRFDRAQRMYLQALKTLATIRRLQIPALQVNIADKQINVGG